MVFVCTLGLFGYCWVVVKILNLNLSKEGGVAHHVKAVTSSRLKELLVKKTGRVLGGKLPKYSFSNTLLL